MHKGLKPRSMSETSHLPTDVESSGQDPSLHYILHPALAPSPRLPPAFIEPPIEEHQRVDLCVHSSESRNAILRRTCPRPPRDRLEFIDPRVSAPRLLRNKDPAVASFVAPVDNGDSGASDRGGWLVRFPFNRGPNFVQIILIYCCYSSCSPSR